MDKLLESGLTNLAENLIKAREEKKLAKEDYDKASAEERGIQDLLIEMMDDENLTSFKHKELGNFISAQRIWTRITNQEDAIKFFEELGLDEEMFSLKPVTGRLNEFVKGKLKEGEVLPNCLDITPTRYISVRKV